jgi:hypothetical protein
VVPTPYRHPAPVPREEPAPRPLVVAAMSEECDQDLEAPVFVGGARTDVHVQDPVDVTATKIIVVGLVAICGVAILYLLVWG